MKIVTSLGQRIFIYSFLLVCISQVAFFILYLTSIDLEPKRNGLSMFCLTMAKALDGKDMSATDVIFPLRDLYGTLNLGQVGRSMWVEDPQGNVLRGEIYPGFSSSERALGKHTELWRNGALIREVGGSFYFAVCEVPVTFAHGQAVLFNVFTFDKAPPMKNIFYHGCILLLLVGGFFSFWIARRVSWPLRRLREEVLNLKANQLGIRVTEDGEDEVAEVARSINLLTKKLESYIVNRDELIANMAHELRSPMSRVNVILALLQSGLEKHSTMLPLFDEPFSKVKPDQKHTVAKALTATAQPDNTSEDAVRCSQAGVKCCGHVVLHDLLDKYLAHLQEEFYLLEQLVDTTLFSERLRLSDELEPLGVVNISQLCLAECERNKLVIAQAGIFFNYQVDENLYISGDESLLRVLCSNIFSNVVKYTSAKGSAALSLTREKQDVVLRLCNTHPHIPSDKLERFFEPFYRSGLATGNGAGLGLSLVKKICLRHEADIRLDNSQQEGNDAICLTIRFLRLTADLY